MKSSPKEKISEALEWKKQFQEKQQTYHIIIGPIFDIYRVMGKAPFYRDSTGRIVYHARSLIMLYSVLIYIVITYSSILSIWDISRIVKPTFKRQVDGIMTSSMIAPQLITPIISWLEMGKHQNYLNKWSKFQDMFEEVTNKPLPKSISHTTVVKGVAYLVVVLLILFVTLPLHLHHYLQWYYLLGYSFNTLGSMLYFTYWIVSAKYFIEVSDYYHAYLEEEVSKGHGYTRKIEEYRLLWMKLSNLIQKFGSSNSSVISIFVLSNMFYLLIITYDAIFESTPNFVAGNYRYMVGGGTVLLFWWILLIVYCDYGFRVTQVSAKGTIHKILRTKSMNDPDDQNMVHMNIFLYTLGQYPPEISVSGYYVVNRALFGSIVTALVTYVIVLMQFHISNSSVEVGPATERLETVFNILNRTSS